MTKKQEKKTMAKSGGTGDSGQYAIKELGEFCSVAESCALQMLGNADFIMTELASLKIAEHYKKEIHEVLASLADTKYDVCDNLFEFNDTSQPASSAIMQGRVLKVYGMLHMEISKLEELVSSLESANKSKEDINIQGAYVLVTESAINIINSISDVYEAVQKYQTSIAKNTKH